MEGAILLPNSEIEDNSVHIIIWTHILLPAQCEMIHVGINVFGTLYQFSRDGVETQSKKISRFYDGHKNLGIAKISKIEFDEWIREYGKKMDYDILLNNCISFVHAACLQLQVPMLDKALAQLDWMRRNPNLVRASQVFYKLFGIANGSSSSSSSFSSVRYNC